jgi:hypothetical protein
MAIALLIWLVASLVATVEENRTTWFLFGLIAAAGQLSSTDPDGVDSIFLASVGSTRRRQNGESREELQPSQASCR